MKRWRVCLYSPADLNIISGSSIWVQSTAEVFHAGPDVEVVLPIRAPERRTLVTDMLRKLDRVELVDPRRQRRWLPPSGLYSTEVLDLIEKLDAKEPFDAIVLRSFQLCLAAIGRPRLRDRLWSTYILEPERDVDDPDHRAKLDAITTASRFVVVQSEEMRALFEAAVPAGRGKTILLPPAVPPPGSQGVPAAAAPFAQRLLYAGKYHPFYPVPRMIDFLEALRPSYPDLEFHAIGDQIFRPAQDHAWADALERRLSATAGVVWHGAMSRDAVLRVLAHGGIGLSLWDYQHGSTLNDLVVSTKLLDYCLAGVPVILNRTAAQETILGADYPLFARTVDEALPLIRSLLDDPGLYRAAAERAKAAAGNYAYPVAYAGIAPYLEALPDAARHQLARPKLPGSEVRVGMMLPAAAEVVPPAAISAMRAGLDARPNACFVIGIRPEPGSGRVAAGRDPAARLRRDLPTELGAAVGFRTIDDAANWWRTIGVALVPAGVDGSLDEDVLDMADASRTPVARTPAELVFALGTGGG